MSPSLFQILAAFCISAVVAALATPAVRALAIRGGHVSIPVDDRWHRRPVPFLGGLAIIAGFIAGLSMVDRWPPLAPLLLCSGLMAIARHRGRFPQAAAAHEADRPDADHRSSADPRVAAGDHGIDHRRSAAGVHVDRRDHQRVQPARQHGRPVRRRRGDCRRRVPRAAPVRARQRVHDSVRGLRRRRRRLPDSQLPSRVDLHGRRRQLLPRIVSRRRVALAGADRVARPSTRPWCRC